MLSDGISFLLSNLEVDAVVKALPHEVALDEAAAGQPIFVYVDAVQTAVSLVMNPPLIFVPVTCTRRDQDDVARSYPEGRFRCVLVPGHGSPSTRYATLSYPATMLCCRTTSVPLFT